MKFEELIRSIPECGIFRTGQILAGQARPADLRRQLNRWVKSGKVMQLRRGVYMLSDVYSKRRAHPFLAANVMKKASYVSLQSALSHYGMIPEYVPMTTSVTTGRPEELSTPIGRFQFRHVTKRLFRGFQEKEIAPGQYALLANPYKALIDLLYLTPHSDNEDYLRELRVTPPEGFDATELWRVAEASGSKKTQRSANRLLQVWKES